MLCKRCKTAVLDTEKVCGYCGANQKHNMNKRVLFVVFWGLIVVLVSYLVQAENRSANMESSSLGTVAQEPDSQPGQAPQATPDPVKTEEPVPTSSPDLEKNLRQVETMLSETLVAVNEFYAYYSPSRAFVSKNGYLYDVPEESYVKINKIVELMGLNSEYAEKNILFFYLRPSDLRNFPNIYMPDTAGLKIFTAYEVEEGYVVASSNSKTSILTRTEIQGILGKYRGDHGPIVRFSTESVDFLNILSEIELYNDYFLGYDVRYMAGDNKYAVAVVSRIASPEIIEEYVFVNKEGHWVIEIPNFEEFEQYKVEINKLLPDLNLNLLPDYNMQHYTKNMKSNFAEVIQAMKASGMITDRDGAASFASGTDGFVYLEFQSGMKFVGYLNDEHVWMMFDIENYEEGEAVLRSVVRNPPLFIMKQY